MINGVKRTLLMAENQWVTEVITLVSGDVSPYL